MPMRAISLKILRCKRRFCAFSCIVPLPLMKYASTQTVATIWAATVAQAEPLIPISKPKMNSGLSAALSRAAINIVFSAVCGSPWARIRLFRPKLTCMKMLPPRMISEKSRAYGITSGVAPRNSNSGSRNHNDTAVVNRTRMITNDRALPRISSAPALSFCPRRIEISEPAPRPTNMPTPIRISISGNTSVTATRPTSPTPCPTKMLSTTLYRALTTMPMIAGPE